MTAAHAVSEAVHRYLRQRLAHLGRPRTLSPELDLFEEGILDSIAITELIAEVEQATGREIDFLEVDPDDLATPLRAIEALTRALEDGS